MSANSSQKQRPTPLSTQQAVEFRKKWDVPDWRKPEEYPRNDKALSLCAWKWEFLRRDSGYRHHWASPKRSLMPLKFNMQEWIDPRKSAEPKFIKDGCHLIDFRAEDAWAEQLHYQAIKMSIRERQRVFSVDLSYPLKPQLKYISEIYKTHGGDGRDRPSKKNIKRRRAYLLRVLDASNEGVSIDAMILEFHPNKPISEKSMRNTVTFAKDFWRRL